MNILKSIWKQKPTWLTYANISSTISLTSKWGQRVLIYGSRYASGILAVGAIGVSAVSLGQSLDSATQLSKAQLQIIKQQSELTQTIQVAEDTKNKLDEVTDNLSSSLDSVQKQQNDIIETNKNLASDSKLAQAILQSNINQQNQALNQINAKTIKAVADLSEVQDKIESANKDLATLDTVTKSTIVEVETATDYLESIKTQIDDKILTLNLNLQNLNIHVDDNLKMIDTTFQSLYSSNSNISAILDKALVDAKSFQDSQTIINTQIDSLITDLQNENIIQDNGNSVRDTRLDTLDNSITTIDSSLNNYISTNNTANTNIQSSITNLRLKIKSGIADQGAVTSGTISFGATMPSVPTVSASLYNSSFSTSGFIIITAVTTTNFSYIINGTPTFGTKISWVAIIDN